MRQGKYLNVILTVNAALLSVLVWSQVAGSPHSPVWGSPAAAQQLPQQDGGGIPNAAAQRQKMLEQLQGLRASVDAMRSMMEGGKVKVIVANADEIRAAATPPKE
jgi:hypothetical protein